MPTKKKSRSSKKLHAGKSMKKVKPLAIYMKYGDVAGESTPSQNPAAVDPTMIKAL